MAWIVSQNIIYNPFILTVLFVAVFLVILLNYLSHQKKKYWTNSNVTVVNPQSFFWAVFGRWHFGKHEQQLIKTYGRLFGFTKFGQPMLYCAEPDLISAVLSKDFTSFVNRPNGLIGADQISLNFLSSVTDENWKRLRAIVSPTFSSGKLRKMQPLIDDCLQKLTSDFSQMMAKNNVIDMRTVFGAFTMNVITQVAFGTKVDALEDYNNPIIVHARKFFGRDTNAFDVMKFAILFSSPKLTKIFGLNFFSKTSIDFFHELTIKIIEERKNSKTDVKRYDFLQLLLDSIENADESETVGIKDAEERDGIYDEHKFVTHRKSLSDFEMISQCVLFFIAGYETTAATLSFATHLLAIHPDIQQKVYEEAKTVFHSSNEVNIETLGSLKYIDAVISETLRLYSPTMSIERIVSHDYTLTTGNDKLKLKKGLVVHIPTYALHMDPEYFPEPEAFRPERFFPENRAHHPYAYLPFGGGPRNCVARRLALMEAKLALMHSVYNFKFSPSSRTKQQPECFTNGPILLPMNINLKVEKR